MPSSELQFLIVGQGLAGSILAIKLMQAGRTVLVLDNDHHRSASQVAAGIINPVTGHRLNISEDFFKYLDVAEPFYQQLESDLGCQIYRQIQQQRLIKNAGQKKYLEQRLTQTNYHGLLSSSAESAFLNDEHGSIVINKTAVVDVPQLLATVRQYLIENGSLLSRRFDYSNLKISELRVEYQELRAKHVIFCEGFQAINNPLLAELPFKLSKGEVLTVTPPRDRDEQLLNWGNWLVTNAGETKLGSNYLWNDLSDTANPTTAAKLLASLENVTGERLACDKHQTGIRPTTKHRIPFIGALSSTPNAYCFNGFGSKGCLTMPYFADQLVASLLHGKPLAQELERWL